MRSIRSYLLQRLLGGALVVLTVAGVLLYWIVAQSLESSFDANLADRVRGLASILFQIEDDVEFEFSEQLMPEYDPGPNADYFQLWFAEGELLERCPSLEVPDPRDLDIPVTPTAGNQYWSAPLPDGRPGRYVVRQVEVHHVYPEMGPDRPVARHVVVAVARSREPLSASLRDVMVSTVLGCVALLGLLAGLAWITVRRGLEPARRLAHRVGTIQADDLPGSLDLGELPVELQPVARKTDVLLQRVDHALKRERRTSADIAHELRTPISELVTATEVALRNGEDAEQNLQVLGTVRDVAWRMGQSVSTLLKLARLEMGAETFDVEPIDLGAVLDESRRSLASLQQEREIDLRCDVRLRSPVHSDPDVVRIIVSNLLSNALSYSTVGGQVLCTIEGQVDDWAIVIQNEAPDLSADDLRKLTQPFWRKDGARSDRDRSGLGLALARALSERVGMRLEFELDAGQFQATLRSIQATRTPTNGNHRR